MSEREAVSHTEFVFSLPIALFTSVKYAKRKSKKKKSSDPTLVVTVLSQGQDIIRAETNPDFNESES